MSQSWNQAKWLLAIDTSTEQAGLALTDGSRMSEVSWLAGRNQTVSVLAEVDHLLALNGIEASDIGAVGVAIGPGMFNGLRVGMSLAKGFHAGLGAALIGVSTLEVGAHAFVNLGFDVASVVAVGRGRLVWQFFPAVESPVNGTILDLAESIEARRHPVIVAGDLTAEQATQLTSGPGTFVPASSGLPRRPAALAEITWSRYQAGSIDDPVTLAPVYLHATSGLGRG